jgi:hypothetical protein
MAKGVMWSDGSGVEVRDMPGAETTLAIIRGRGVESTEDRPLESRMR